ncbi:MAG: UvrD-helicase domain-containing protein [Bacteroidales bacterium]|nr:UvrD-helicase domain-containing protein [Bacteroidales bacterium]
MAQRKFQVYKSSAGSGKTFTLVREFLQLVIVNPNHYRNILAITFTNKAANEMKSRIVNSLVGLAKPPGEWTEAAKTMVAKIMAETGFTEEIIHQRAVLVISNILHNYSDLSAATIDSFMQRVIRTFSLDLSLPMNYEVELDVEQLRMRAVDRLIDQSGSDKELTDLLVRYLETKTEDDKSWRIENDLNEAAEALFREDGMQQRDALKAMDYNDYQVYYNRINHWLKELETKVGKIGVEALELINNQGIGIEDFAYGKNGPPSYFLKMANKQVSDLAQPSSRILAAVNDGAWTSKKQQPDIKQKIEEVAPRLIDFYQQSRELIDSSVQRYTTLKLLLRHLYPMAVLGSIESILEEIRNEDRILPISEFNRIIAAVTQTETIPYIYERLGEKYHHLMIDEFQDTSVLQWQNLLPLVENALSEDYLNLVVGDAKQAIYRWRGGEVDQFIALPKLPPNQSIINALREQTLVNNYENQVLPVNWRSHKAIVEFNNQFFQHLANRLAPQYKSVYDSLNQQYNPLKSGGFVQVDFFYPKEDCEQLMLDRLPGLIAELTEDNFSLRDITILCRTNKQGSTVANHLLLNGIKVISSESLLLGFAENVRLVVCMLRIIANASDQLAYPEALAILSQKNVFDGSTLNDLIPQVHLAETEGKRTKSFSLHAFESLLQQGGIHFSRKFLMHLPLYDLAEELIRVLKLSAQDDIYLQFFLNGLHTAVSKKSIAINELQNWWDEKGKSISVIFPESLDAVKVMTIHKAKGLEFPVVIFPFATALQRFTVDNVWVDLNDPILEKLQTARLPVKSLGGTLFENIKDEENDKSLLDLVNLIYVVFTRAEERLYIMTTLVDDKKTETNCLPVFLFDFIHSFDPQFDFSKGEPWKYSQKLERKYIPKHKDEENLFFQITGKQPLKHWQQKLITSSRDRSQWLDDETEVAISFGTHVHELLAAVRKKEDLDQVLGNFVLNGKIPSADHERVRKTMTEIINHPKLEKFFSGSSKVLSEPEILLPGGEIFRPDRVFIDDQLVHVIEFKTGLPRTIHKAQLQQYMELIKGIYDQVVVKGLLVYAGEADCTVEEI